jgi:hypothetical protein
VNFGDGVLETCADCGWALRGRDVPNSKTVADVMLAHRQGGCPAATHLDGVQRPNPMQAQSPDHSNWSPR